MAEPSIEVGKLLLRDVATTVAESQEWVDRDCLCHLLGDRGPRFNAVIVELTPSGASPDADLTTLDSDNPTTGYRATVDTNGAKSGLNDSTLNKYLVVSVHRYIKVGLTVRAGKWDVKVTPVWAPNQTTVSVALSGGATLAEQQVQSASLSVLDDWDEANRAAVNVVPGQVGITAGAGAVAANTPRVTHASDDPAVASLQLLDDVVKTDDSPFTPGTDEVAMVGAVADETTPDSVDEGDAAALRMTLLRLLKVETAPGKPTTLAIDEAANDSDKTITPTAGRTWQITSLRVSFVSTATVGNRQLEVQLRRASDSKVLARFLAAVNQAASLTREYLWQAGGPQESAFSAVGDRILLSLPTPLFITDTEELRIYDAAAVDAAADDMSVFVYGTEVVE